MSFKTNPSPEREARRRRLDALMAQLYGIDVTRPGWGDELRDRERRDDERRVAFEHTIATPHVDEAIESMEKQFEVTP